MRTRAAFVAGWILISLVAVPATPQGGNEPRFEDFVETCYENGNTTLFMDIVGGNSDATVFVRWDKPRGSGMAVAFLGLQLDAAGEYHGQEIVEGVLVEEDEDDRYVLLDEIQQVTDVDLGIWAPFDPPCDGETTEVPAGAGEFVLERLPEPPPPPPPGVPAGDAIDLILLAALLLGAGIAAHIWSNRRLAISREGDDPCAGS